MIYHWRSCELFQTDCARKILEREHFGELIIGQTIGLQDLLTLVRLARLRRSPDLLLGSIALLTPGLATIPHVGIQVELIERLLDLALGADLGLRHLAHLAEEQIPVRVYR